MILALVFAVASVVKFRNPTGTRRSLAQMGLPVPRLLATVVPVVEALTAVLLIVDPRTGGPCAVALLVAFSTLVAGRLLAGQREGCGCFGAWSTGNLSWRTLARNAVLVAIGVVATLN
jgi:uncharacterized membrane protein YphA (DoxX/SURF4 family)